MNKKGFMFIESITVLLVVVLSLTLLISSYSLVTRKSKENEYYDLPSDKYLLYVIGNLGENSEPYGAESFVATKNNCESFMSNRISNCKELFNTNTNGLQLYKYIIIHNLNDELLNGNITQKEGYDSGIIEYLKTLKRCKNSNDETCSDDYVIGVFYKNNKYYYVSLKL